MLIFLARCRSMWSSVEFVYTCQAVESLGKLVLLVVTRERYNDGVSTYPPTLDQYLWGKKGLNKHWKPSNQSMLITNDKQGQEELEVLSICSCTVLFSYSILTNKVDYLYKQATIKSLKADIQSAIALCLSIKPFANCLDKGLTL